MQGCIKQFHTSTRCGEQHRGGEYDFKGFFKELKETAPPTPALSVANSIQLLSLLSSQSTLYEEEYLIYNFYPNIMMLSGVMLSYEDENALPHFEAAELYYLGGKRRIQENELRQNSREEKKYDVFWSASRKLTNKQIYFRCCSLLIV